MNKKYLTKTIIYFFLALAIMPMLWFFLSSIIGQIFISSGRNVMEALQTTRYLNIAFLVLEITFLSLGIYNLIKLLEDKDEKTQY
ncbi:MAG: hypothetical protein mread185_000268 [Mycoplasmataceae bacterium]|nr:MAG: hypothetical protein mread185_000268 [Mycoplasmataceae bacterium]